MGLAKTLASALWTYFTNGVLKVANGGTGASSASAARTALGLGTIATQDANNVTISGGSVAGITDLAVADGGTGASSLTANNVLLGNGTSAVQFVAPGTSGNVLTSNGTTWVSAAASGGLTPSTTLELFDDFTNGVIGSATPDRSGAFGFQSTATGTSASTGVDNATTYGNSCGIAYLSTGTDSTGSAGFRTAATGIIFGLGETTFEGRIYQVTASDGTHRYTTYAGFTDNAVADAVDGVYFRQVDSVNGGEWQGVCRNNSTESTLDTNTAVTAGAWMKLKIVVNAAGSSAEFFINGSSVGTISSNIPTGAGRDTGLGMGILKSVGSGTARVVVADYFYMKLVFTSAR